MSDDIEPTVVDAALHSDAEVTAENATHVHKCPDGSRILVGPIALIQDPQHGVCLQVQYVADGSDGCQAWREIAVFKERGDRALLARALELHGDLVQLREQAPALFEAITSGAEG